MSNALANAKSRLLDLPPLRAEPRPVFTDAASARRWIDELPLLNVGAANGMMYNQLEVFTSFDISAEKRFEALELLRPHIVAVQNEHAKKYRAKPSPLSPQRRETLSEVYSLWDVLARAYLRCVESLAKRDTHPHGVNLQAVACQRAMDAIARKLVESHYAYVRPQPSDFKAMHRIFAFAERENFLGKKVRDPLLRERDDLSVQRVYARALLLDSAKTREHRSMAIAVIERWLDRWAGKVVVGATMPGDTNVPPLYVDIGQESGASREPAKSSNNRAIDVGGLALTIDKRIYGLRHGKKPEDLDLGFDLSKRDFEGLLVALRRQWCEGRPRRQFERDAVDQLAHASNGLTAAHFYLGKRPFEQPFSKSSLPTSSTDAAPDAVARRRIRAATDYMLMNNIHAEQWIIRDRSITGLGLVRPLDETDGARLTHGMLMTLRPRGGGQVLIGNVQWLEESVDGDLNIGLSLIPGVPCAVAARFLGDEKFFPVVMLAPVAGVAAQAAAAPSSLLLPAGSYTKDRIVEVFQLGTDRVRLTGLLEAGTDYERVAYMPAGTGQTMSITTVTDNSAGAVSRVNSVDDLVTHSTGTNTVGTDHNAAIGRGGGEHGAN